jgi:hypothetical protein
MRKDGCKARAYIGFGREGGLRVQIDTNSELGVYGSDTTNLFFLFGLRRLWW